MVYTYFMPEPAFFLQVSRIRFWIYLFGPYLIGIAAGAVEESDVYMFASVLFGIYFTMPANILVYGINDIFDYETDRINAKKAEYEMLVRPGDRSSLISVIILLNLPFWIAAFFLAPRTLPALGLFLFFSIFYSAPPIRAKTKPFLDSIFNVLYIFPGVFSYQMLTGEFPPLRIIVAGGFWTMAMHAYSAIPDIKADREASLQTVATVLGAGGTLVFCLIFYTASAALAFPELGAFSAIFAAVFTAMIFVSFKFSRTDQIFKVYKAFPIVNAGAGFVLFWIIALNKFL
ncbi:MAG: prenyltransferase [Pyrinomonadaceae bacterium]|nr:prenyltransferase [Pyrinomonadaceae bacterium]